MEELFYEIFSDLPRQGPGSVESTINAAKLIGKLTSDPEILDVGCGTGAQTLELAKYFGGQVTAIDNHQPYLEQLKKIADKRGLGEIIDCVNTDMLDENFGNRKYELIWAEGSIYIIGFRKGLSKFKDILATGGFIAVTEVSWFKRNQPEELLMFWNSEYPDIKTINNNLKIIDTLGYKLIGNFKLPDHVWWDDYYLPLESKLVSLREKYFENDNAVELIEYVQHEIDMYRKYSEYYGYVFYIMQTK